MLDKKIHTHNFFLKFLRAFFFLSLIIYGFHSSAQIDSLKEELRNCKTDTSKVNILMDLSYYTLFIDIEEGKSLAIKALDLATKINFERGIMRSYGQLGNVFNAGKKYDEAIEAYLNGLRIAEETRNNFAVSNFNHNIGLLYLKLNQHYDAIKYFEETIKSDLQIGDSSSIAISYNSLGSAYLGLQDVKKAKTYFLDALKYIERNKAVIEHAAIFANLGSIYNDEKSFTKSIDFYKEAISICLKNNSGLIAAKYYIDLASVNKRIKNYKEAILDYQEAIHLVPDLTKSTQNDFDKKLMFIGLADTYMILKDYENAAKTYYQMVKNYDLLDSKNDSIQNRHTAKAFADMATKYETDKKDAELKLSRSETLREKEASARKNVIIYSFIAGGLLLLVLLLVVFRSYRISRAQTRKINIQKDQIEKQRDEITHIHKEITASIEYAKNIQNAILPDPGHISRVIPEHFVLWLPRDIVSGDFYWFHEDEENIYMAAADCTGHGVPGAFVSVSCVNILNQVVIDEHISEPGKILSRVHQHVCDIFRKKESEQKSNDGMDIALCKMKKNGGAVTFAGAMNPIVRVRNGECLEIKGDRMAIGGRTPYDYSFKSIEIDKVSQDRFYLFSDGFKDQFGGPEGKKYLNKRFLKLLENLYSTPLHLQKSKMHQELVDWCGNYSRIDDVLVWGFKV